MSNEKNFFALFARYKPTSEIAELLAGATDITRRLDADRRMVEVTCRFPTLIAKETVYRIEREIEQTYSLSRCILLTRYDPSLFNEGYLPQIVEEAKRVKAVTNGFLDDCQVKMDGNEITFTIGYGGGSVGLLERAKASEMIENIIRAEFGIETKVHIRMDAGAQNYEQYQADMQSRLQDMRKVDLARIEAERARIEAENAKNREFTTLDMFPTTLAAIGCKIEGNRLGLGTNLFSSERTLSEQLGMDYLNAAVKCELPIDEICELLDRLISEDRVAQTLLKHDRAQIAKELEKTTALIAELELQRTAKENIAALKEKLASAAVEVVNLEESLQKAEEKKKSCEKHTELIAEIEARLPEYLELDGKVTDCEKLLKEVAGFKLRQTSKQGAKDKLVAEIEKMKERRWLV